MKVVLCLLAVLAVVAARPQEGKQFSNEAIRQAQDSFLIPRDAQIQKVEPGIELAAYEGIPGGQRVDLTELLGSQVPYEVINNLQTQFDQIGRN